jgi:hypothetical protein
LVILKPITLPYHIPPIETKFKKVYAFAVPEKQGTSPSGQTTGDMFFSDQLLISLNEFTVAYSTGSAVVFPGGIITVIEC